MSGERLDTEARKLLDRREDNDKAQAVARKTKGAVVEQERVVFDLMKLLNQKTSGTLELGEGYGDVQLGRRETIRSRIIDHDRALEALEAAALVDEMVRADIRRAPLNELVRTCLETGQALPEGVDFTRTPFIQVTRKK